MQKNPNELENIYQYPESNKKIINMKNERKELKVKFKEETANYYFKM